VAGQIARERFKTGSRSWNKQAGSPVSEADLEIDAYLHTTLLAVRPSYGWLSEESTDDKTRLQRKLSFIVDPIDGTVAFLKHRPHFTICAAVECDGKIVAGVVYNPVLDDLYKARTGGGAWRNGDAIHVSNRDGLAGCTMLGDHSTLTRPPWPQMKVETRNSVAYRVALVADGSFDATISLSAKRDWDLAAAEIILREAGGCITDPLGAPLIFNTPEARQPGLVAAGSKLHREILAHLRQ
jgi:myo-inositol-1(or 4)-monophosphatase